MIREAINELKKYTSGKKNTERIEVSVLNLNRIIFALEEPEPILDKVRAEIEKLVYPDGRSDYLLGFNFGLMRAAQVIDKYKGKTE